MTSPYRRDNVMSHVVRLTRTLGRAMPAALAVRASVAAAGLAGIVAGSSPDALRSGAVLGLAVLVLMPAVLPRGLWPSAAIATVVGWYLLETATVGHVDPWRPILVAACVYGVHTGSALAAVLPYDAVVGAGVLGRWALRAAAVVVLTAGIAVFVLALPHLLGQRKLFAATLGGLAVLAVIAVYLVYLGAQRSGGGRRRRARTTRPGGDQGDRTDSAVVDRQ